MWASKAWLRGRRLRLRGKRARWPFARLGVDSGLNTGAPSHRGVVDLPGHEERLTSPQVRLYAAIGWVQPMIKHHLPPITRENSCDVVVLKRCAVPLGRACEDKISHGLLGRGPLRALSPIWFADPLGARVLGRCELH